MPSEKTLPKKLPKSLRPPDTDLNELRLRLLETHRTFTTEIAQMLCELQKAVSLVQETRRKVLNRIERN